VLKILVRHPPFEASAFDPLRTFNDGFKHPTMRRRQLLTILTAVLLVAAFWPWLGNPFAYAKGQDRFRTSVPIALLFGTPCEVREGAVSFRDPGPNCYRFSKPQRFAGVWLNDFESSVFFEGRNALPSDLRAGDGAWLLFPDEMLAHPDNSALGSSNAFHIEFTGRRTAIPGAHGHGGMWQHQIIVDDLTSFHAMGSPARRSKQ
jgi:hypothetical protein